MERNALGFVLQLSRWVGLAPYVRTPGYQVSRAIDIAGKIVSLTISTFFVVAMIVDTFFQTIGFLTIDIIYTGTKSMVTVIVALATYTASERITRMFQGLKQLQQIDENISCRRKTPGDRKMYYLVVFCLLLTLSVRAVYLTVFCYIGSSFPLQFFKLLVYQIMVLLEMQLITFAGRVLETLEMVNQSLEQLMPKENTPRLAYVLKRVPKIAWDNTKINRNIKDTRKNDENIANAGVENTNVGLTIRELSKHYFNICQIIRATTKGDGYLMVLLILSHIIHLEISLHRVVIWCSINIDKPFYYILPAISRNILHSASLIFLTEIYHQTHEQMNRTHKIINYVKFRRIREEEVKNELDLFTRVLLLNKTTYSPLKMCTLSRSLVVKIFGCLVTYLVIMLTYGPKITASSLAFDNDKKIFL